MKTVILAAGKGVRLGELTDDIPKVMLKIKGKPILQIIIEKLKRYGMNKFVIIVGYQKEKIMNYFEDGSKFNVDIKYAYQKEV